MQTQGGVILYMPKAKKPKDTLIPVDGFKQVVEMLQHMDESGRLKMLHNLAAKDPALVKRIEGALFTFDDLIHVAPKEIQLLLREVPQKKIALALRGAAEPIKQFLLGNLSPRAAQALAEEIQAQGPKRKSEIEAAREEVLAAAKKLETQGKMLLRKS